MTEVAVPAPTIETTSRTPSCTQGASGASRLPVVASLSMVERAPARAQTRRSSRTLRLRTAGPAAAASGSERGTGGLAGTLSPRPVTRACLGPMTLGKQGPLSLAAPAHLGREGRNRKARRRPVRYGVTSHCSNGPRSAYCSGTQPGSNLRRPGVQ